MRIEISGEIPGSIVEVFDFLDDPASIRTLNEHASEHVAGLDIVETATDGRRTVDIQMRAGKRAWVQTIEQVERQRPSRLVTRGWTWMKSRDDAGLVVMTDRCLVEVPGGTRLTVTVDYLLRNAPLAARIRARLQAGAARLELVNGMHRLIDHFASRDVPNHD